MPGAEPRPPFRARPRFHGGARPIPQAAPSPHQPDLPPVRSGRSDEVHLDRVMPDPFARLTLALMRWHFQTFAVPETQGWLMALRLAANHVGPRSAGALCCDVVALVQALRAARSSPFRFNPEGCACCRVWLMPEERRLLELFDALRRDQTGRARTLVQLLCDGVPDDDLLGMARDYLDRNAPDFPHPADTVSAKSDGD